MPADDALGPDEDQVLAPVAAESADRNPEQLVAGAEPTSLPGRPGQYRELMPEQDMPGDECLAVTDGRTDKAEEEKEILEHRPNIMPLSARSCPGRLLHPHNTDGSAPLPRRWVLVRNVPGRRPPLALFCTDPTIAAEHIVARYVDRWHIETTFEEVRAQLGLETQREWSTRAVGRAVPCVLGLFSLVVLIAQALHREDPPTRRAAWYPKSEATFIDALAAVRRHLWASQNQPPLGRVADPANSAPGGVDLLIEAACYAA
jgi:hypothetical protein